MNSPSGPTESTVFENHSNSWFVPQISIPLTSIPIPHCTLAVRYTLSRCGIRENLHMITSVVYTQEKWRYTLTKTCTWMFMAAFHNNQKVETTPMSINWWMDYVTEPQCIGPKHSKANRWDIRYAVREQSIQEAAREGNGGARPNPLPQRGTEQAFYNHRDETTFILMKRGRGNVRLSIKKDGERALSEPICNTHPKFILEWRLHIRVRQNSALDMLGSYLGARRRGCGHALRAGIELSLDKESRALLVPRLGPYPLTLSPGFCRDSWWVC